MPFSKNVSRTKRDSRLAWSDSRVPLILLVDDDDDQRFVFQTLLETTKCVVVTACSGKEALGILRRMQVDLVISDVLMPGMSGAELISAIRRSDSFADVPVIAMSCASGTINLDLCKLGANAYLRKQDARALIHEVAALLEF